MTTSIEDLQRRVEVLEAGARAERVDRTVIHEQLNALQGSQDAVLSILRDHGRLHAEHTAQFERIDARFERVDARFDRLETKVDNLETKVDNLETKVDGISGQLGLVVGWIQNQP